VDLKDIYNLELQYKWFYISHHIWKDQVQNLCNDFEIKTMLGHEGEMIAEQFIFMVLGERIDKIEFPSTWWQAFKERWFPKFLLNKFPVDYKRYVVDLHYPLLPIHEKLEAKRRIYYNKSPKPNAYPYYEDSKEGK
jgi:hypothetical protein